MCKQSKNQSGFSVIEALLALIFVALVVLIGVYVVHNHNTKTVATTAASTTKAAKATKSPVSSQTTNTAAQTQYLKIPELGIELPLSSEVSDLTYYAYPSFNGAPGAILLESGSKLAALYDQIDSSCQLSGAIAINTDIITSSAPSPDQPVTATATVNGTTYYKFAKGGAGNPCSNWNPTVAQQNQIDAYAGAATTAFENAQAL